MAISELQRLAIHKLLTQYCDTRVPAHVRDQVRLVFRIEPHSVVLSETRPRFDRPTEWLQQDIAKFRYVASRREWRLYCQRRDLKWHQYEPHFAASDFATLLNEVDTDPTGIFWG